MAIDPWCMNVFGRYNYGTMEVNGQNYGLIPMDPAVPSWEV